MGSAPTFESWRPAWARYGDQLTELADAAFPDESADTLSTYIVSKIAAAFVRETSFDPFESMLLSVFEDAAPDARNRAIEMLTRQQLEPGRRDALVCALTASRSNGVADPVRFSVARPRRVATPAFEEIRAEAQKRWLPSAAHRVRPGVPPRPLRDLPPWPLRDLPVRSKRRRSAILGRAPHS